MKNSKIQPLKKFGQNFLNDPNIIRKIISAFDPAAGDSVLEIGPGQGALTRELSRAVPDFKAVELDSRCVDELRALYPQAKIIHGDFLKMDIGEAFPGTGKLRVIGNIPYYITSPILFKLLENRSLVKEAVMMVQLEIGQRLNAVPRTKEYGILAVIFQTFCKIELLFKVSPNVFTPVPKVWSAVIRLTYLENIENLPDEKLFVQVVRAAFGNRRKVLRNSFSNSMFSVFNFEGCPIDLSKRAEELTTSDFKNLTAFMYNKLRTGS